MRARANLLLERYDVAPNLRGSGNSRFQAPRCSPEVVKLERGKIAETLLLLCLVALGGSFFLVSAEGLRKVIFGIMDFVTSTIGRNTKHVIDHRESVDS